MRIPASDQLEYKQRRNNERVENKNLRMIRLFGLIFFGISLSLVVTGISQFSSVSLFPEIKCVQGTKTC